MYIFQPDRHLLQKQISAVAIYMKGDILDVGAGEFNRYGKQFKSTSYTTMDVHEGPNVDIVGSIEAIPFEDNRFDSVVCTQVFEHLAHPQKSAAEVFRVLKPGGHLLVTVPQTNELHEEPYDFFRYTNFGLRTLFEDAGFTVVDISQRGGFFTLMAQLLTRYSIDRFKLYKHPILGRVANKALHAFSALMFMLDRADKGVANRKHTIGWCIICKK